MATDRNSDDWHFGTVGVLLVGSLTAVVFAVAYPYGWVPAWTPAGISGVGAGLTVLSGRMRKLDRRLTLYRAACWLGLGGWATAVNLVGISPLVFLVLAALDLAAAMLSPAFTPEDDPLGEHRREAGVELGIQTPTAISWKKMIDKICGLSAPGVTISAITPWDKDTGYSMVIDGPAGSGFTFRSLNNEIERLAAASRMKPGCVPHATPGADHQGQAVWHVPTIHDTTAQVYPRDYSPLSVNDLQPIGFFPDTDLIVLELRQGSMIVIGPKGGGKTTLLHNVIASLARCIDGLQWHIDMNMGGMSAPWLLPWLDGKCDEPVVDWFAFSPEEALLMSRVGRGLALHRKVLYARRAAQANSSLVPMDADVPEVMIVVDEGAELLGELAKIPETGENVTVMMRLGRAVGANVILSSTRPTGTHVPVEVRNQCAARIGMRVEEKDEYDYLFPGTSKGIEPHMITEKGEMFIQRAGFEAKPRKGRSFDLKPDQITEISIATQDLHPTLDEASLDFMVEDLNGQQVSARKIYAERWQRAADYLRVLQGDAAHLAQPEPPVATPAEVGEGSVQTTEVDLETEYTAWLDSLPVAEPDRPGSPVRTLGKGAELVIKIVTEPMMMARVLGEVSAAGQDVTRQTVYEWLQQAIEAKRLVAGKKKGQYQPFGWPGPNPGEGV